MVKLLVLVNRLSIPIYAQGKENRPLRKQNKTKQKLYLIGEKFLLLR